MRTMDLAPEIALGRSGADSPSSGLERRLRFYMLIMAADLFALFSGFELAAGLRLRDWASPQTLSLVSVLLPLHALFAGRALDPRTLADWKTGIAPAIGALLASALLIVFLGFALKSSAEISRLVFAGGLVSSSMLLVLGRMLVGRLSAQAFRGEPLRTIVITDGLNIAVPDRAQHFDASVLGLVRDHSNPYMLDRLAQSLVGFDRVLVAVSADRRPQWASALKGASVRAYMLVPELDAFGALGCEQFAGCSTVPVTAGQLRTKDEMAKRALDLGLAVLGLMFFAPLLFFTALAIKLESPGPALFVQKRVGRGNKLFSVYKFRSMQADHCDSAGTISTGRADTRVTRVGRFIRATSIDELPQLFNILRGEMSFVGPRPHALGSLAGDQLFWEVDQRYHHRHACKPGLTGLAQIRGYRGATHRREDLLDRLHADLEYVRSWSVWRDLAILFATAKVVVHRNAF